MCKTMISPGIFLFFLRFWAVSGVNGEKIAQNEKQQLNVSCAISQGQYSI